MTETVETKAPSAMKLVRDFFGMKLTDMKAEWTPMPQADKDQIIAGLRDGSLNY